MEYLLDSKQAKAVDTYTIQKTGIPSLVLMERASLAVAEHVHSMADKINGRKTPVLAVCGKGNNGGDGIAAARILFCMGYPAAVLMAGGCDRLSEDAGRQLEIARKIGVPVYDETDRIPDRTKIIIDALFGIGLTRDISGAFAARIEEINLCHEAGCRVCSVDIASGIHTDTGKVMGVAVKADITVTFGWRKLGMILYPGAAFSGNVYCEDIGFDPGAIGAVKPEWITYGQDDLMRLPARDPNANKGSYGRVLAIAGSRNMAGAACFCGQAAYRTGCGLVTVFTPECNRVIIQQQVPEAVLKTYAEDEQAFEGLDQLLDRHQVIVIGPGLGMSETSRLLVDLVLSKAKVPVIIDADALNIIAEDLSVLKKSAVPKILTPHLLELSRLTGINIQELKENRREICEDFRHQNGVICISKDARTAVFDGSDHIYLNTSGNDGMATGGSGDALSGIIAGLMAQKMSAADAAKLGVYIHGLAGDMAAREKGPRSMIASDIITSLVQVLKDR